MFDNLQERFERAFKVLKGHGQITEVNVGETLKEVRKALLDADVDYKTAKDFINKIKLQRGSLRACIGFVEDGEGSSLETLYADTLRKRCDLCL